MGNWTVRVYWTLNKNFIEFWFPKIKVIPFGAIPKPLLHLYICLSNRSNASEVIKIWFSAILYGILYAVNQNNLGYVIQNENIFLSSLMTWGSWFISFSGFIPISLLVTVEIVRYGQGMKLHKDEHCSSKGQFTDVQTSNLN